MQFVLYSHNFIHDHHTCTCINANLKAIGEYFRKYHGHKVGTESDSDRKVQS